MLQHHREMGRERGRGTHHISKKRQNGSAQQRAVERNHANVPSGCANAKTEKGRYQRTKNQNVGENGQQRSQRQTVPTPSTGSQCGTRSTQCASSMPSHAHGGGRWSTSQAPRPVTTASPRCGSQTIALCAKAPRRTGFHVGAARTTPIDAIKEHAAAACVEQEAPANLSIPCPCAHIRQNL